MVPTLIIIGGILAFFAALSAAFRLLLGVAGIIIHLVALVVVAISLPLTHSPRKERRS